LGTGLGIAEGNGRSVHSRLSTVLLAATATRAAAPMLGTEPRSPSIQHPIQHSGGYGPASNMQSQHPDPTELQVEA